MLRNILFFSFTILVLISCTNDTTKPTVNDDANYLPMKVGNYWVYQYFQLDPSFRKIDTTLAMDSIVITESKIVDFRTAFVFDVFRNGSKIDQMYFSSDYYGFYKIADSVTDKIETLSSRWIKFLNLYDTVWNEYGSYDKDLYYNFDNLIVNSSLQYVITGYKSLNSYYFTVNDTSVQAYQTYLKKDRIRKFYYNVAGYKNPANINIIQLNFERFYMADKVGIVAWQVDPYSSSTKSDSTYSTYKANPVTTSSNGWRRELLKYHIQK